MTIVLLFYVCVVVNIVDTVGTLVVRVRKTDDTEKASDQRLQEKSLMSQREAGNFCYVAALSFSCAVSLSIHFKRI